MAHTVGRPDAASRATNAAPRPHPPKRKLPGVVRCGSTRICQCNLSPTGSIPRKVRASIGPHPSGGGQPTDSLWRSMRPTRGAGPVDGQMGAVGSEPRRVLGGHRRPVGNDHVRVPGGPGGQHRLLGSCQGLSTCTLTKTTREAPCRTPIIWSKSAGRDRSVGAQGDDRLRLRAAPPS